MHLPDPRYLEIHNAYCKVAYMSGVAAHLNRLEDDLECMCVLAEDGGSANGLCYALTCCVPSC